MYCKQKIGNFLTFGQCYASVGEVRMGANYIHNDFMNFTLLSGNFNFPIFET